MNHHPFPGVAAVEFLQPVNGSYSFRGVILPTVPKSVILEVVLSLATFESGKPAVRPGEVVFKVFGHGKIL